MAKAHLIMPSDETLIILSLLGEGKTFPLDRNFCMKNFTNYHRVFLRFFRVMFLTQVKFIRIAK